MPIVVRLDELLTRKRWKSKDLAAAIGLSEAQMSMLRSGKIKGVRFGTLAQICALLDCQPGDILQYVSGPGEASSWMGGDPTEQEPVQHEMGGI
jgi:putative transcriptional regulator